MRIPVLKGTIKRRLLVNFRVDPLVLRKILPEPFRLKLHQGNAIAGICLIRLEQVRPNLVPAMLGISSENAAHRIAVEWDGEDGTIREGVFIPRRDTGSRLNSFAGGRVFPGEHHHAKFTVRDDGCQIDLAMQSDDGKVSLHIVGKTATRLPETSCFADLTEASAYFEGGCLGYSVTRDANRLDGIVLRTLDWKVEALDVTQVSSSYFDDLARFPRGSIVFDHALVMRDLLHEWRSADDFVLSGRAEEMTNVE